MNLQVIFDTNLERCKRWHEKGIQDWSPLEWAGAMAGEAGEAANAAKKLKRIETNMMSINEEARSYATVGEARMEVAKEVADTILYGLLLMARVGIVNPEEVIASVFNKKSIEYGFPERL
jgi:hypothetical protein